jgi:hypothetical protein
MRKFVFVFFAIISFNVLAENNVDPMDLINHGDAPAVITYEV